MIKEFIDYAFYGNIVGHDVKTIENAYKVYCKLFDVKEVDNILNRICNEYLLFIEKGTIIE
nr:MAG TPA: hypothetical protein [Caudoviricetes sp.]